MEEGSAEENQRLRVLLQEARDEIQALTTRHHIERNDVKKEPDLLWRAIAPMPCGIVRPHVAVGEGGCVYVGGGNTGSVEQTRLVFKYEPGQKAWIALPITPYFTFSLALVDGSVAIVGGVSIVSNQASAAVASFVECAGRSGKWGHLLPTMPTAKSCTSSVCVGGYLVVIGGIGSNSSRYLRTVEVLDVREKNWSTATPFPMGVTFMSLSASSTRLFLTGGLDSSGAVRSVISCTIVALVSSAKNDDGTPVWEAIVDVPALRAGCCVVKETLVVFGGMSKRNGDIVRGVYALDLPSKTWRFLGDMPARRSSMSLAVTGESRVMVVGGYLDPRNWVKSLTTDVMEVLNIHI